MTDVFISDLPAASTLGDGDWLPLDQGTRSVRATVAQIRAIPPDGLSGDAIHGGTISDFASTGIDDHAGAKLLTLSAAGGVGIGTADPQAAFTVRESRDDLLAAQILLRNDGAGHNTAAVAFQVAHPAEYSGYAPKGAVSFERYASNGVGILKLYNRGSGDMLGYQAGDVFLAHYGVTGRLALTPAGGASVDGTRGEGQAILDLLAGGASVASFYEAAGIGAGVSATAARVQKNSVTGRSVNAAGTVNATGLDYAEYMEKSDGCGMVAKGQLVGVDGGGRLTDRFDDAHSFVVKSTSPSYVGGDVLTPARLGTPPAEPVPEPGEQDDAFATRRTAWEEAMAAWQTAAEAERLRFDRIAFCGQVPVALSGAWAVGDYVLSERAADGGIAAVAVAAATLDVDGYRRSVGRIWRRDADGRPVIAVKVV